MKKITFTTNTVFGPLAAFFNSNTTYTLKFNVVSYNTYSEITGVHVSTKYREKMDGVHGITGTCKDNEFCAAMQAAVDENGEKAFICGDCYANSVWDNVAEIYANNARILSNTILHTVPAMQSLIFRFNSHDELHNDIEYLNFYFHAACNKGRSKCALWTKRPDIVERVHNMLGLKKLDNLTLVLSSPRKNEKVSLTDHPLFDHVFTVYTKDYAEKNGIKIVCGGNSCSTCARCYSRKTGAYVSELLKSDAKKGTGKKAKKGTNKQIAA